jgi:putative hydrolase of the HAD superfamily
MINTVVFDLDDTLYNEIDYCKSGFMAVARFLHGALERRHTEDAIYDVIWHQFESGNHTYTFNAALEALGVKYHNHFIQNLVRIYRNHTPTLHLPEDSRQVLDRLSQSHTLALLTDGFLPAQKLKVRSLKIERFFKMILYTEQMGRQYWKPSPLGFQHLMKGMEGPANSFMYVADNPRKDFIAPNQLGWTTVQVIREHQIHTQQALSPESAAHYVLQGITPLPALLEEIRIKASETSVP